MGPDGAASGGSEPGRDLPAVDGRGKACREGDEMKNILIICRKELKGYFSSPIAYLLMAFFALIFGFFFYSATRFLLMQTLQAQMMGRGMPPMDLNEWIIRPLLMNDRAVAPFLIPLSTMRL